MARKLITSCLLIVLIVGLLQIFFGAFVFQQTSHKILSDLGDSWSNLEIRLRENSDHPTNESASTSASKSQKRSLDSSCKKWKLLACAMVHNEAAYLLEWIEFHRGQGVDHFVFYTYFSTDLLEYVPMIYEDLGTYGLVDVIPARFFAQDAKRKLDPADYAQNKEWSMVDCNVRYREHAQWIMQMDAGHFVHSEEYNTILDFLENQTENALANGTLPEDVFTAVRVPTVRFGTSGVQDKFLTWITPNAYTGGAEVLYEPYRGTEDLYPLVIESNPKRAPHGELDGNLTDVPVCSGQSKEELQLCSDSSTVTIVKSGRCPPANITECLRPTENLIWPELPLLRADNHNWRAVNHAKEAKYWDPLHDQTFDALDTSWFSSVLDDIKFKYISRVREGIMSLKPRLFLDVNRTCDPVAMKNGQQVMCPPSHPYPYGNFGGKWLRECCEKDIDYYGEPLTIESNSCWNYSVVDCPDPPGVEKWLHRSCCVYTPPSGSLNATMLDFDYSNDTSLEYYDYSNDTYSNASDPLNDDFDNSIIQPMKGSLT
ncbi:hypothetical protein RvY_12701 [Ramazzottius varieornatus]|uniref:Glycosyltransferase family 92 protein n=1 Tax=Ramazzottius varieornatus TaxID=947166 RepID=A0A1D1VMN9_RAMVA|nr:hypothetical protein RvY_12701 [Ramazzottius varieornatus]